jgi:hypothetical protein
MAQKYRALYVNTYVRFIVASDFKSPHKRSLQVIRYQAVTIDEQV